MDKMFKVLFKKNYNWFFIYYLILLVSILLCVNNSASCAEIDNVNNNIELLKNKPQLLNVKDEGEQLVEKENKTNDKIVLKKMTEINNNVVLDEKQNDSDNEKQTNDKSVIDSNSYLKKKNDISNEKKLSNISNIANNSNVIEKKTTNTKNSLATISNKNEHKNTVDEDKKKAKINKNEKAYDKLFTLFDKEKALSFNYDTIKSDNYGFLEQADEINLIKQMILEQKNPKSKNNKSNEKEEKKQASQSIVEKLKEDGRIKNILSLRSLVFLDEKDWNCRVNKQTITYRNKDSLKSDVVSILKVDKGSVVFVMNNTSRELINIVENLINKRVPYYKSYFIVKLKHKTYVAFKLFIGQKINLDDMKISG